LSETDLVTTILGLLRLERGTYAWRNNTGAIKRGARFVRFGEVGAPDIMAIVEGTFVGLECKAEAGRLSPEQRAWGARCQEAGGRYNVVRSVAEAREAIREARRQ